MRLVLVGPYPLDPERVEGGVETSFMTLLGALARVPDLELHAIAFASGLERPLRREVDGITVDYLPRVRRVGSLAFHVQERRSLARLVATLGPDLVHAHDTNRYGYICLKALRGVPVVVAIHGISRAELRFEKNPLAQARVLIAGVALERYCIRNARYLVEPTRYPEDYFGDGIRGRVWDIAVPISDKFFAGEPTPEPGRILYCGSVIPRKRLLDLVEALPRISAAVPTTQLFVAGGAAQSGYAGRLRARAGELGVESRIVFLGQQPPVEMVKQYRSASVFVLPSGQETSPGVIAEAMAGGVPVVATDVGGVKYLIDDGVTGHTVEVGDVRGLADSITGILADPARAAELGAAGRDKADRHYRLEVVAERYRAMYLEVLEDYRRTTRGLM